MRKLGAWSQLTTQKARRVRQAWQTGGRGTGTASRYCDVESLSRFPPFRSRDLPWPLSFWLFKRSPYPGAFFPHGCSAGAGCPGRAQACHGPQSVAVSLLPSCLFSESSVPHKLLPGPGCLCYTGIRSQCSSVNVPGDIAALGCLPQASGAESCTVWSGWEIVGVPSVSSQVVRDLLS